MLNDNSMTSLQWIFFITTIIIIIIIIVITFIVIKCKKTTNKDKGVARCNNPAYSSPLKKFLKSTRSNLHLKHFTISVLKHELGKDFHTGIRRKIKKWLQIFV